MTETYMCSILPDITSQEAQAMELHPDDRYQLRKAQMDADRRALEARKAQQDLERLVLELEHKYGLIGDERSIEPRSASVQGPEAGPAAARRGNGKETQEALEATILEQAPAA